MIPRVRVMQFKQFESYQNSTEMRLTMPDANNSDTYVTIKLDGRNETLRRLVDERGKMFRVTIEEIG